VQRPFDQLVLVRRMQIEELAAGMGHAADFGYVLLKACFGAGEIIANQLAVPSSDRCWARKSCPGFYQSRSLAAVGLGANYSFLKQCDYTASPNTLPR
jgi:hypothetical protein